MSRIRTVGLGVAATVTLARRAASADNASIPRRRALGTWAAGAAAAASFGPAGCSTSTPSDTDAVPAATSDPATTEEAALPAREPTPAETTPPAPVSATEWCQTVYAESGVVDYVLRMGGTVYDTDITGTITPGDDGESYALMCGGYQVVTTVLFYATSALAEETRAQFAGWVVGEPASLAGQEGDFLYSTPDASGGGANFSWETERTDFNVALLLYGVAEIPEAEIRDVMSSMVATISDLPLPEVQVECLGLEESLQAVVADNSDELGLDNAGTAVVAEYVATISAECGRDAAALALSTIGESEVVMENLYAALGDD